MNTTGLSSLIAGAAAAATLVLAGCGSSVKLDDDKSAGGAPVESRTAMPVDTMGAKAGANSGAVIQAPVATVDLTRNGASASDAALAAAASGRVVYFDYDSFVVKDDYRPVILANAKLLGADRTQRLALEGHTDERGGREYNLALGQKRAEAVAKALMLLGATEGQVEAVSFGKERPAAVGSDEAAWAKNRRVELSKR